MEIPRYVFIVKRSWSPVTSLFALAAIAHSMTASSSGSRQALTLTLGLTMSAFMWISEIMSSKMSGDINFLSFGFSSTRSKSSKRAGERAMANSFSAKEATMSRQTPGNIMALRERHETDASIYFPDWSDCVVPISMERVPFDVHIFVSTFEGRQLLFPCSAE